MEYTVRWLPSAGKDLQEIRAYLDEEVPEMAAEVVGRIFASAEGLSFMPTRFQIDNENPEYRRVIVLDTYKIFFRVVGKFVQINHIRHTARNNRRINQRES